MDFRLELINKNMGNEIYEMYQDIPSKEMGSTNQAKGCTIDEFYKIINSYIDEQNIVNAELNTTTNRYIFYVENKPIGELGIRTTENEFWMNKGSQLFYKIRMSYRGKGYGNKLLELGLNECKKIGMKRVRINCDDNNIPSKNIIIKSGGKIDIASYKTSSGYSSSYIIELS